ncbi:hypothetical protein, partial [Sphingobacterium sp. IITKGP-BTPF85]|uniref:hypothetical protein n=1 Tax=Sphingobacterium sp. IITKGP-BTPF85 TaxID=1338009 RepID=UPI0004CE1621
QTEIHFNASFRCNYAVGTLDLLIINQMKKILQKISLALQVVLMAPIKLPGKALNIIKYIALGLGVVETVMDDKDKKWEGGASTRADPDSQRKGGAG